MTEQDTKPSQPSRCVIYARVSTVDQDAENQMAQLRKFAAERGWTVLHEIVDVCSGGKDVRDGMDRVNEMAEKKEFDIILFWALDRLSREGSRKTIARLQAFDDAGVKWHSFTEQYLSSMGPFADAIISLLAVLANQEKLRISERTKAGLARVRANGQRLGRPSSIPQQVIEIMRERRAAGATCRALAREFSISFGRISQLTKGAKGVQ